MSSEKDDAIVLRCVEYSESSLIVTLFTSKFGKVQGLAKGARRLKNPFETSLDLLSAIKLSFIRKRRDSLDLLTEAKLARRFRPTRRNYTGLVAGYYLIELLNAAVADYQPYPELWKFADHTLAQLQRRPCPEERIALFETYLLDALGILPATRFCVTCGRELPLDATNNLARQLWVDLDEGGVVCRECLKKHTYYSLVKTNIGAFKTLETALKIAVEMQLAARVYPQARDALYARKDRPCASECDRILAQVQNALDTSDEQMLQRYATLDLVARQGFRELMTLYVPHALKRRLRTLEQFHEMVKRLQVGNDNLTRENATLDRAKADASQNDADASTPTSTPQKEQLASI
ncbi:MAG: DNA repair protein RecO [Planctomycetia bacterium]|nr:DNA repair protein RecO [Planctomycetia bacterium]